MWDSQWPYQTEWAVNKPRFIGEALRQGSLVPGHGAEKSHRGPKRASSYSPGQGERWHVRQELPFFHIRSLLEYMVTGFQGSGITGIMFWCHLGSRGTLQCGKGCSQQEQGSQPNKIDFLILVSHLFLFSWNTLYCLWFDWIVLLSFICSLWAFF